MDDLKRLRELAEANLWTGKWYDAGCGTVQCVYADTSPWPGENGEIAHPEPNGTARYIAALSPAVVLSLVERVERAEADAARYRWLQDHTFGAPPEPTPEEPHVVHTSEDENWREAMDAAIDAAVTQLDKQEKQ